MSFDPDTTRRAIAQRLENSYGLSALVAKQFATAAVDEMLRVHGGDQHYIPKRVIDREAIRAERAAGVSVEVISRRHGISTRTVLRSMAQDKPKKLTKVTELP